MSEKEKNALERQTTETALINPTKPDKNDSNLLSQIQVGLTLQSPFADSDAEQTAILESSVAKYNEFAPADATERMLTTLSLGLQNAVMESLRHAVRQQMPHLRSQELISATKGALAVSQLLEALDRHRG